MLSHDSLLILPAGREHHSDVMKIFDEARAWHQSEGVSEWPSFDPEEVLENIERDAVTVVIFDSLVIGTVTVFDSDPLIWKDNTPAFYIHRMATSRRFKGHGLSRMMVDHLSVRAAGSGKAYLRLDCWAGNDRLKRHYESLGFSPLQDVFMGEARSLPAHYWNSTTTLFEKPVAQVGN